MKWNTEAKVGAFTLAGLIVLAIVLAQLSSLVLFGKKGYIVHGVFPEVGGLVTGNAIRYRGVEVGRVDEVHFTGTAAAVEMRIYDGIGIPRDAQFAVDSEGILGEKFIRIQDGNPATGLLKENDTVAGGLPIGMDALVRQTNELLVETQATLRAVQGIVADPELQRSLRATIANAETVSGQMIGLTATLQTLGDRLDAVVYRLDGDGRLSADVRAIAENFRVSSERIRRVAGGVGGLRDKKLQMPGQWEVLYNTDKHRTSLNAQWRIGVEGNSGFGVVGVEEFGNGSLFDLQLGREKGPFGLRAGLIRGKVGVGADYRIGATAWTLDVYDLDEPEYRFRGNWQVKNDWSLVGQAIFPRGHEYGGNYFGINHTF